MWPLFGPALLLDHVGHAIGEPAQRDSCWFRSPGCSDKLGMPSRSRYSDCGPTNALTRRVRVTKPNSPNVSARPCVARAQNCARSRLAARVGPSPTPRPALREMTSTFGIEWLRNGTLVDKGSTVLADEAGDSQRQESGGPSRCAAP
jgi:hypothetical protein